MKKIKTKNKRVIVAMSGGVDSSVAAALLQRAGFDVVGVFMKFWSERDKSGLICVQNRCCSPESEKRARLVAAKLGIPFYVFNFEKEFKKKVVDYFLKNYKLGLTPNPCVVCNKEIKFKLLFRKFPITKTNFVATGHYARIQKTKNREQRTEYKLLKGRDKEKDQSYFLCQLKQKMLGKILFPVGDYTKNEIKKLAKKFKLPVLNISESQEICFVIKTINDFLKRHLKPKPGPIVEQVHYGANKIKGKIIGKHQGLYFYTIGQRKGIKLPGGPFYVLEKDLKRNLLIVTKNEKDLYKKELIAKNVNWVSGKVPKLPLKIKAKIRYRHEPVLATIMKQKNSRIKAIFNKPQRAITPGQSVVFYLPAGKAGKGQELLGGGIIC